jgi:mono/diheme cytochrome c family protein
MRLVGFFSLLLLVACAENAPETVPGRWYTEAQVEAGRPLYDVYCAQCHGADGGATPDWRTPDASGNYPPPPLNGSAHTWHHPTDVLTGTIADGGAAFDGVMPGFGHVLDESDRLAIVARIQSWWSDDIYRRWAEIDIRSR